MQTVIGSRSHGVVSPLSMWGWEKTPHWVCTCESVSPAMAKRKGIRAISSGYTGTHSHLWGVTNVLSANYRLKSDKRKIRGKKDSCAVLDHKGGYTEKKERERRIEKQNVEVVWVLFNPKIKNPSNHLCVLYCIIPSHSPHSWVRSEQSDPDFLGCPVFYIHQCDFHVEFTRPDKQECCYNSGPSSKYVSYFWLFDQHGGTRLWKNWIYCLFSVGTQHLFCSLLIFGLLYEVYGVAASHYKRRMVVYKLPGELGILSVCHDLIVHYVPVCEMFF